MDFSAVVLTDDQQAFAEEVRAFLDEHLTPEVYAGVRAKAEHFDKGLILALGAKGWLMPRWRSEDGGAELDDVCVKILETELARRDAQALVGDQLPWPAVEAHADPGLRDELKPQVASGEVRFCLGYTEPDGGSDIAGAKTRAVRDGDEWVINGQKIFTSNAQNSQYVFLITRTDPTLPKHKGMTMFLVPTSSPGFERQPLPTIGDETTNVSFYSDIRLSDRYRIGEVNNGWSTLHGPLDVEHHIGEHQSKLDEWPWRRLRASSGAVGRGRHALGQGRSGRGWTDDRRRGVPGRDRASAGRDGGQRLHPGGDGQDQGLRHGEARLRGAHRPDRPGRDPAVRRGRRDRRRRHRIRPPAGPAHRDPRRHGRGVPDHHRPARPGPAAPGLPRPQGVPDRRPPRATAA